MQYHIQALLYSLGGLGLVWAAGKLYKRHAISQFTILNDLPALGTSRQDGSKLRDTVIICGGRYVFAAVNTKQNCELLSPSVLLVCSLPECVQTTSAG